LKKGEAMKRNDIDIYENDSYNNLMNNKIDKKTMKKNEIIRKSIHVIFEKGYNGTGVKDLTDAAGIPKGSLYNYFENKEDYLKEALNLYYNEMSQKQFSILSDKNLEPLDRIKKFYSIMIEEFEEEFNCKFGCFVGNITQEMSGVNKVIQKVTNEIHNEIVQIIKGCLVEAVEKGDLPKDKNTGDLAEFMVSSWQGALLRTKASNNKKIVENFYKILVEVLLK
jgi:TetR/AcrR family transcriptional regulator, transcriptional repressor for nem operon